MFYRNNTNNHENDIILSLNGANFSWTKFKNNDSNEKSPRRSKGKKSTSKYVNLQRRDSSIEAGTSEQSESGANTPFKLNNITIDIRRGDFIGIIGTVGSGKSSLLNGILAEMVKIDGEILTCENHSGILLYYVWNNKKTYFVINVNFVIFFKDLVMLVKNHGCSVVL